ncbi:hypothetical protein [Bartonella sp. ML70XJBT]|uniref:hypothetical protein n=1 Tax=Bartonella sp. ML70XJBT TaxID=3019096 RepID=UPI00235EB885|nr:hypothetical protein [Bartonella sp. ML70XJBT]
MVNFIFKKRIPLAEYILLCPIALKALHSQVAIPYYHSSTLTIITIEQKLAHHFSLVRNK